MKSKKKILLGIILSFIVLFTITGCINKKSISASEFTSKVEEYGLKAEDDTKDYTDSPYNIGKHVFASNDNWSVEFFELESDKDSKKLFSVAKAEIESAEKTGVATSYVDLFNHQKITYSSNEYYIVASRIGNTLVYIEAKAEYKDDIKAFIKTIDY